MKKIYKILIPSVVAFGIIGTFIEDDTPNTSIMNNNNYTELENKIDINTFENNEQIIDDETEEISKKEEIITNESTSKSSNKTTNKSSNKNSVNKQNNDLNYKDTSNKSDNNNENTNLPLKAICNDGTISYQDDSSKDNYRGMCSGHNGIKEKLGRTE